MTNDQLRAKAVAAFNAGVLDRKIVIETDLDTTPVGKRKGRIVKVGTSARAGRYACSKGLSVLRWYVGGRIYRQLELTAQNVKLTNEWLTT